VVVDVGLTVMDVPVPTSVPPQLPVYQAHVLPDPPLAVSVLLSPEQIVDGLALASVGATGSGFTVTGVVAQVELPQPFSQRT
jgi:hypothetical protein